MIKQEIVSSQPLIGISANLLIMEGGHFPGQERAYVNHDYVTAVVKAKGAPVLLPVVSDKEALVQQVRLLDGLLLSGGSDVQPLYYGKEPLPHLETIYPERDQYEMEVVRLAYEMKKPIFGICRGLQLINVAFGGTLYQDLSYMPSSSALVQHRQKASRETASHTVDLVPHTLISQLFNRQSILTNSFHHQAIDQLAPGFIVNARARDGVIEGIERHGSAFFVAVQWHPEMMVEKEANMLALFQAFIQEARAYKSRSK